MNELLVAYMFYLVRYLSRDRCDPGYTSKQTRTYEDNLNHQKIKLKSNDWLDESHKPTHFSNHIELMMIQMNVMYPKVCAH